MSAVIIRAGRADDIPRLADIERSGAETFARFGQPLADGSTEPGAPEQWARTLADGLLWVADDAQSGPIGFLGGEITADGLYVIEIDVLMERQKQGHGRRLMLHAIDWARGRGLAAVTLTTFRSIPWNAPFYAALGFVEVAPDEASAELAGHLTDEAARGFEDRCAMRLAL